MRLLTIVLEPLRAFVAVLLIVLLNRDYPFVIPGEVLPDLFLN